MSCSVLRCAALWPALLALAEVAALPHPRGARGARRCGGRGGRGGRGVRGGGLCLGFGGSGRGRGRLDAGTLGPALGALAVVGVPHDGCKRAAKRLELRMAA